MDLLERARALAACPLFSALAPAVVIRLAERARSALLQIGERRTTDDHVWVVVDGSLVMRGRTATAGHVIGLVRVVAPQTAALEAIAAQPSHVVGVTLDDMRDVLEEDPLALAALSDALARLLLEAAT